MSNRTKRIIGLLMAALLALQSIQALAWEDEPALGVIGGALIAFAEYDSAITVPLGTAEADIGLPETLTATVEFFAQAQTPTDKETTSGSALKPEETGQALTPERTGQVLNPEEPGQALTPEETGQALKPQGTGQALTPQETAQALTPQEKSQAQIPVTWQAKPEYNGEAPGEYAFTAVIAAGEYALLAAPPVIIVTVADGEKAEVVNITIAGGENGTALYLEAGKPVTDADLLSGVSAADANGEAVTVTVADGGGLNRENPQPKGEPVSPQPYIITYAAGGGENRVTAARECYVTAAAMPLAEAGPFNVETPGGNAFFYNPDTRILTVGEEGKTGYFTISMAEGVTQSADCIKVIGLSSVTLSGGCNYFL
jgi:hypothetical protein